MLKCTKYGYYYAFLFTINAFVIFHLPTSLPFTAICVYFLSPNCKALSTKTTFTGDGKRKDSFLIQHRNAHCITCTSKMHYSFLQQTEGYFQEDVSCLRALEANPFYHFDHGGLSAFSNKQHTYAQSFFFFFFLKSGPSPSFYHAVSGLQSQ